MNVDHDVRLLRTGDGSMPLRFNPLAIVPRPTLVTQIGQRSLNGVWPQFGFSCAGEPLRAFQPWLALPPSEENALAESQYIAPDAVQEEGHVRVILGRYGQARSMINLVAEYPLRPGFRAVHLAW